MNIKKIEADIDLLIDHILEYKNVGYLSGGLNKTDHEFIKMWRSFNIQRKKLLQLDSDFFSDIEELPDPPVEKFSSFKGKSFEGYSISNFDTFIRALEKTKKYIKLYNEDIPSAKSIEPIRVIENLFEKFDNIARQLQHRHDNRDSLIVTDEYDVQDLLHALLHLFFIDIRPEEWTPSYAGKSSRIDFLLKNEKIIVETKMTRKGLSSQKLGDELIIDTDRYKMHPDCKILYCFIYDPEHHLYNPSGLESDLSKNTDKIDVKVIIRPK